MLDDKIFVMVDTRARFRIIAGFVLGLQWTIFYKSRPTAGTKDTDTLDLMTSG